jgi:ribosomal-protein-alanine N-acetyltransferase
MTEVPSVRTQRLLLRAWRSSDRESFARMNADPQVMQHFPKLFSAAESNAAVDRIEEHWRQRGYGLWAVERLDTGEFIGFLGLATASFEAAFTPAVEVGWRLAAAHWGQGFATEGGRAALDFAFNRLGLAEVVSFTAVGNVKSVAVMQRLGLAHEPSLDFEHPAVPVGHPARPHVLYRISRQRWLDAAASRA